MHHRPNILIPNHIAIIMDGNGRWASQRKLPRNMGHEKGARAAKKIVEYCKQIGVNCLTLYMFSSENWDRPPEEVKSLMSLLKRYLRTQVASLIKNDVKIKFIGRKIRLDDEIKELMIDAENKSSDKSFNLTLAINYGARDEIRDAAEAYAKHINSGSNSLSFDDFLCTKGIPDPDLLIRTGGELRISNFLLWQLAYTELYFTKKLWPDFGKEDLLQAVEDYSARERRFGT